MKPIGGCPALRRALLSICTSAANMGAEALVPEMRESLSLSKT
jgi:hypothetical protein